MIASYLPNDRLKDLTTDRNRPITSSRYLPDRFYKIRKILRICLVTPEEEGRHDMPDTMTSKARWLAAIQMEPVDRLPFWPKFNNAYPMVQTAPFRDMDVDTLHEWIGSDRHNWVSPCIREVRKTTSVETYQENGITRTVYRTPRGETELVCQFDAPSHSYHPMKFPIETLDDIRLMTEFFRDVTLEPDHECLQKTRTQLAQIDQDAITAASIGESPLMYLVEWLAGVDTAHYLLFDHQEEVETLFDTIHETLVRKTELMCEHHPADLFYFIENTSTTLISPEQYKRYCAGHVGEYAEIARQAGRSLTLHMCGHLKALLPDLAKIPARAFEAFTSPTLGNTTLMDGRTACPDKCLIGGTNAILWTRSADEIITQLEIDLNALPHHRGIVVTSAGVMPPMSKPETIRKVCDWVRQYPVRN